MNIEIFLNKSVEQNASLHYEKAKKARQKRARVLEAIKHTEQKLLTLQKEKDKVLLQLKQEEQKPSRKKEWYEKFRWFYSSEGFLCIGGRDATSNEIVIKKHAEKGDLVLHTDMAGSPFFVIKNGEHASEQTINEAAQATASYSKAWKEGLTTLDVFYVKPEQVTKKARSGEYMAKGAFIIYGETKYMHPFLEVAVGIKEDGQVIGGAVDAIKTQAKKNMALIPGRNKMSDTAKKVKHFLQAGDLDEIMHFIPPGGCDAK